MRRALVIFAVALAVGTAAFAGAAASGSEAAAPAPVVHNHATGGSNSARAANLRVTLDRLLGEHTLLAIQATQRGLQGGKEFPALGKALDRNSVELANAIGSVFGAKARNEFLNGKFMWRAHIN